MIHTARAAVTPARLDRIRVTKTRAVVFAHRGTVQRARGIFSALAEEIALTSLANRHQQVAIMSSVSMVAVLLTIPKKPTKLSDGPPDRFEASTSGSAIRH